MKSAIIIMAKVPAAGNVKTRLQPFLSPDECAALAKAFLLDAVSKARSVCENVILAYSPPEKINALRLLLPSQSIYIEQTGRDLGQRMFNAFEFVRLNFSDARTVVIGTDSPTFPAEFIEQAFDNLSKEAQAVVGKTTDGGFYLLGLRRNSPRIFENIEWSSAAVSRQLTRNLKSLNYEIETIPEWFDVDQPADLNRLRDEILNDSAAQSSAPETFRWLIENSKIFDQKF